MKWLILLFEYLIFIDSSIFYLISLSFSDSFIDWLTNHVLDWLFWEPILNLTVQISYFRS